MEWITSSIRNKLLAITGAGTTLVLAAALFGIFLGWQAISSFESCRGVAILRKHVLGIKPKQAANT
ncbi:hypothetical protein [Candidatus Reidiella endopervernicosa]|uniref:Uncharacterized protein n=1 Tax=Candidatus Reidiella endopervernicosa TaxID=2738883 RepID=A0A6N0HTT8_9GAMM|nr:hypothetical protein [Candidatus Reidiella endopervernicosa]QKQ25825.1 hypothetical protein HUE57_05670 [Candidatus Reidiella endopervernicosa]